MSLARSVKAKIRSGRVEKFGFSVSWSVRKADKPVRKTDPSLGQPPFRLNIGPGGKWEKPSDNWLAVDIDPDRGDIVVNFQQFEAFPLADNSVDAIYASHVFEHISMYRIGRVMAECNRVLMPGGVLRIIVPNPEVSIREYVAGNDSFPLFVKRRERAARLWGEDWTLFECLKGDFVSKNGQPDLLGEELAHQNAWDFEAMRAALARAGFDAAKAVKSDFQNSLSSHFDFEGTYVSEANEKERSLYVEVVK